MAAGKNRWTSETSGETDGGRLWYRWNPGQDGAAGQLTVGATFLSVDIVGEVERIEFPDEGDKNSSGDILFSLAGSLETYEWACPLQATVVEVNGDLLEEPELLNDDPQDAGWLVKLEVQDESELDSLLRDKSLHDDDEEEETEEDEDDLGDDEEWEDEEAGGDE